MSILHARQVPKAPDAGDAPETRSQYGAICYRFHKGRPQVLLITSRGRGRWIIPKGWPMDKTSPEDAAAIEAYEEAGVLGLAHPLCLGIYSYQKGDLPCVVSVFAVEVQRLLRRFPEAGERKRQWFAPMEAAALIDSHELSQILAAFHPEGLPPGRMPRALRR